MEIEEYQPQQGYTVTGISDSHIEINGQTVALPVALTESGSHTDVPVSPELLTAPYLQQFWQHTEKPELIIIGYGKFAPPSPKLVVELAQLGVGVEVMNTAAAVRTQLVLQSERRRVWAWFWQN